MALGFWQHGDMVNVETTASGGERCFRSRLQIEPNASHRRQIKIGNSDDAIRACQSCREEFLGIEFRHCLFEIVRIKPGMQLLDGLVQLDECIDILCRGTPHHDWHGHSPACGAALAVARDGHHA